MKPSEPRRLDGHDFAVDLKSSDFSIRRVGIITGLAAAGAIHLFRSHESVLWFSFLLFPILIGVGNAILLGLRARWTMIDVAESIFWTFFVWETASIVEARVTLSAKFLEEAVSFLLIHFAFGFPLAVIGAAAATPFRKGTERAKG